VGSEEIQVFVYPDEESAISDASKINSDGGGSNEIQVLWVAPPHFYRNGAVIILYVGSDEPLMHELEHVLGPQFAGR